MTDGTDGFRPSWTPGADEEGHAGPPVVRAINQPTVLSAGAALAVALGSLLLLAGGGARLLVLAEAGLLSLVVVSSVLDEETAPGLARVLQGAGAVGALMVVGVAGATVDVVVFVGVLPAMVGAALVALAVFPRRGAGSRRLLKLGSGALLISPLASGILRTAPLDVLVLAALGSVLAWDLGEQAISLGEHLGRRASTRRLEVVHAGGGTLVAGVALLAVLTIDGMGSPGLPLHSFLLLAVAVVVFAVSLYD